MGIIATWNPERDCWETEQFDLLSGLSDVFSETWPRSGMTLRGTAYALPTSGPRTDDSGSSSAPILPTPTVDDAGNVTRDSGAFQSLTRSVQQLSSPRP